MIEANSHMNNESEQSVLKIDVLEVGLSQWGWQATATTYAQAFLFLMKQGPILVCFESSFLELRINDQTALSSHSIKYLSLRHK